MRHRIALVVLFAAGALLTFSFVLTAPRDAGAAALHSRATPTPDRPPTDLLEAGVPPQQPDAPPLPDLVVTGIRILPNPVLVGRLVTIEVTIANLGDAPVADENNFFVELYINPDVPVRSCLPGDYFWGVQGYEIGSGSLTLRASFDPETQPIAADFNDVGIVPIAAQVDNGTDAPNNLCGFVVESREDNNILTTAVDVSTRYTWSQTTPQDFQKGFTSALDLTHPLGVLQNGTGWFDEPRFPPPEDPAWPVDPLAPWDSTTFYNPDLHVEVDNFPDNFPPEQLQFWNPPDQEKMDLEIGQTPDVLYAVWEDARNGDLNNRRIYFAYSTDQGKSWLNPIPLTHEPGSNEPLAGTFNQLNPDLVIDRVSGRLFVFWEDNRGGNYDIYFARSFDFGFTWEEPVVATLPVNPINDLNISPSANQVNVSADVFYNEASGQSELFVVWEDYRNGNADLFFEWSRDNGDTWLKTEDADPTTIDANIHIQPNPTTNAGIFDQKNPALVLDHSRSNGAPNYCIEFAPVLTTRDENGVAIDSQTHFYPYEPLPAVYVAWEDERDIVNGDPSSIYYTRGEFNFEAPFASAGTFNPEPENCDAGGPRVPTPRQNLPPFRFEDDHLKVNDESGPASQINPTIGFDGSGFITAQFGQSFEDVVAEETYNYTCEARYRTRELVVSWQDDQNGDYDIWANNVLDDVFFIPTYSYIVDPEDPVAPSEPPPGIAPLEACLGEQQTFYTGETGIGLSLAPTYNVPAEIDTRRNAQPFSPQPPEFFDLAFPEESLEISDGLTFTAKPLCQAPNEPPAYTRDDTQQFNPDSAILPTPAGVINIIKSDRDAIFRVGLSWHVWADTLAVDNTNQDIFTRPVQRYDRERTLTVNNEDGIPIALQTVQDNVKNQVALRQRNLFEDFEPPTAQQNHPSITFNCFDTNLNGVCDAADEFPLFVGWDDNRNANPLLGFEGNKDVYAARLRLDDELYGELRPTRSGSYVSSVFDGAGQEVTWYDIEWWGDISADGVLNIQTRFGMDPSRPEPPLQNTATNGWTQWTGIGGVGGFYNAPGQHITGPDGNRFPTSYYIQYRVNFNPSGGGQQGIICLSEVDLHYELPEWELFVPILAGGPGGSGGGGGGSGALVGEVVDATNAAPLAGASVCVASTNQCTNTDGNGFFSLTGVPAGDQRINVTAGGYVPLAQTVAIAANQTTDVTFALTPPLGTGEVRIVLTWNQNPSDLDSHLWLPPAAPYHIYFANGGNCGTFPNACLDTDDVTGFGPETITISSRESGTYLYAIHRFAGSGTLSGSGAKVQVYDASGLRAEFLVPTGSGDWWSVFEFNGSSGAINPINVISVGTPAPYLAQPPTSDGKADAR